MRPARPGPTGVCGVLTSLAVTDELLGPLSSVRQVTGLDPRQAAFLEAIGFGLDTVDLVYRRLAATLRTDGWSIPLIFADAWAIIDWMDRLDGLVVGCPGMQKRDGPVRDFRNTSSLVAVMRDIFQHPRGEISGLIEDRGSLWGRLTWQRPTTSGHEVFEQHPFSRYEHPGDTRLGAGAAEQPRAPVDRVTLFSPDGEVEIGITGQWEAAVRFAFRLAGAIQIAERPAEGERIAIDQWLPVPADAMYPALADRLA